jgi:type IV pilus assembly protein PilA
MNPKTVACRGVDKVWAGRTKGAVTGQIDQVGFTLIELMVVLLIMGILLAIAIPTFLGTTKSAEDKQAQANLSDALIAAKSIYTQTSFYPLQATLASTDLPADEPELQYTTSSSARPTLISIYTNKTAAGNTPPNGQELIIASYSDSGVCWIVKDIETAALTPTGFAGPHYGIKVTTTSTPSASFCTASSLTAYVPTGGWKRSYPPSPPGK